MTAELSVKLHQQGEYHIIPEMGHEILRNEHLFPEGDLAKTPLKDQTGRRTPKPART